MARHATVASGKRTSINGCRPRRRSTVWIDAAEVHQSSSPPIVGRHDEQLKTSGLRMMSGPCERLIHICTVDQIPGFEVPAKSGRRLRPVPDLILGVQLLTLPITSSPHACVHTRKSSQKERKGQQ